MRICVGMGQPLHEGGCVCNVELRLIEPTAYDLCLSLLVLDLIKSYLIWAVMHVKLVVMQADIQLVAIVGNVVLIVLH